MAIYHLSLKAIQRSNGRSSTASAAYRSRAKIIDNLTGKIYDFSRRKGVEESMIFIPDGSKISRENLWNLAEKSERRKDGITAREYELALPSELDPAERKILTENFCNFLMKRYGVAMDVSIHAPTPAGDERNFHAHVLITTRRFTAGQLLEKTDFDLSGRDLQKEGLKPQKEQLEEIRAEWEILVNQALENIGSHERVSHKSNEERGIKAIPTVHMGVAATALERKGIATDRGELNRRPILRRLYGEFIQVKKELQKIEAELAEIRQQREAKNGKSGQTISNNQDERPAGKGERRKPDSIIPSTVQTTTTEKSAKSGFIASTATRQPETGTPEIKKPSRESSRPVEKTTTNTPRTTREAGSSRKRPEIACGGIKPDSQGNGRIFTERTPRGVSSGSRCGSEGVSDGRADWVDLASSREIEKAHWLDQLEAIKDFLIKRIMEYRTIVDLLAMKKGIQPSQKDEEKTTDSPDGPK